MSQIEQLTAAAATIPDVTDACLAGECETCQFGGCQHRCHADMARQLKGWVRSLHPDVKVAAKWVGGGWRISLPADVARSMHFETDPRRPHDLLTRYAGTPLTVTFVRFERTQAHVTVARPGWRD